MAEIWIPDRGLANLVRAADVVQVSPAPILAGPVYPVVSGVRRTSAVQFVNAADDGTGGKMATPHPGLGGTSDFTISVEMELDAFPERGVLLSEWGDTRFDGAPLGGNSWVFGTFEAAFYGLPGTSTWADGFQFWIQVGAGVRFMNIPTAAFGPANRVQLVVRGRMALESAPAILAPDTDRLQAWIAVDGATALSPVAVTHGDAFVFASPGAHPSVLAATTNPIFVGGSNYNTASDFNGRITDTLLLRRALSDAEIAALRPGPEPADFAALVAAEGSWWRMGGGAGDAAPTIVDQGANGFDGTLTNDGAVGGLPTIVAAP